MKNWNKYLELAQERPGLFTAEELEVVLDEKAVREFEEETGREVGIVYESPWRYMLVDLVRNPAGKLFAYERVVPVKTGGVAVLPVYQDGIVLIRTYRHSVQRWRWEIPRGFGSGVSVFQNAIKELFEETGIEPSAVNLVRLGKVDPDSGLTADQVDVFLAEIQEFNISLAGKEDTESISHVRFFPTEGINRMIASGEITDGFTLSAFTLWRLRN